MGSGAAKPSPSTPHESHDLLPDHIIEAASEGNSEAQDQFFERLNALAAAGKVTAIRTLMSKWKRSANSYGAREASCIAVKHGQAEALKTLLDVGVRPYIGRNDPDVNPLIHAVDLNEWSCVELLIPRALKYNFSTGLLQAGMMQFVISGDHDMVHKLIQGYKIPGNSSLLCAALLLGREEKAEVMVQEIMGSIKDLNELCSLDYTEKHKGWENFAAIHAACKSRTVPTLAQTLIERGADLSQWGKDTHHRISFAKRLPLHYAVENKKMTPNLVKLVAMAYPEGMFAHVNDKANRDLPCQCSETFRDLLEELMYQHVCESFDGIGEGHDAGYTKLMRMALLFEKVRTMDDSKLSRGKLSFVVDALMPKKLAALKASQEPNFSEEAGLFAEMNPRTDLGKETSTKVAVKSMADIGKLLKSDFWELLKLAEHCNEAKEVPEFEEMLCHEIQARLRWVAGVCGAKDASSSDVIRYGMFVVAGLIADIIAAKPKAEDGEEKEESAGSTKDAAVLSSAAAKVSQEFLEVIVGAYCKDLDLPPAWNLLALLQEGLMGRGIKQIVFSGGDLVIKQEIPEESPRFQWIQGLFEETFLKRYTRDRKGGKVPDSLKVHEVEQVLNCGSWGEYALARQAVWSKLQETGPAWEGQLRTDACSKGEAAGWFRTEKYPGGVNEHWLYHGTSLEGERGITEGDFRLNLAGSNAGTLYGNGVYLAEAVSKSDEYTSPHGKDDLRTMLLCLSCLGRVNYNDEKRPDGDVLAASCQGGGFHSILGDREKIRGTYREIIVFDENLIYPGYICHYTRVN